MFKTFTAKFGPMRKPQEFVVYPRHAGEALIIQSERVIAKFDEKSGVGMVNFKRNKFMDLLTFRGAVQMFADAELIKLALEAENVTDANGANGAIKVLG